MICFWITCDPRNSAICLNPGQQSLPITLYLFSRERGVGVAVCVRVGVYVGLYMWLCDCLCRVHYNAMTSPKYDF